MTSNIYFKEPKSMAPTTQKPPPTPTPKGGNKMKFEVGTQWKTRCGLRAVVVDEDTGTLVVWHSGENNTYYHGSDGTIGHDESESDLIEPWVEKKSGEVWVNVFEDGGVSATKKYLIVTSDPKIISRVKVKWTEGQFDE